MQTALIIIHVIIAIVLTVIVLMQHGKQQGLSGAIAGGAETFFGKNKGRTIDAMLKKFTAVIAVLFIISSITLTYVSVKSYNIENPDQSAEGISVTMDEEGNLVDEAGNILMTAEDMAAAEEEAAAEESAELGDVAENEAIDGDAQESEVIQDSENEEAPAAE